MRRCNPPAKSEILRESAIRPSPHLALDGFHHKPLRATVRQNGLKSAQSNRVTGAHNGGGLHVGVDLCERDKVIRRLSPTISQARTRNMEVNYANVLELQWHWLAVAGRTSNRAASRLWLTGSSSPSLPQPGGHGMHSEAPNLPLPPLFPFHYTRLHFNKQQRGIQDAMAAPDTSTAAVLSMQSAPPKATSPDPTHAHASSLSSAPAMVCSGTDALRSHSFAV